MRPVAVVTDSTHYLPRALADEQGIHQVSLYVGWQGEPVRELDMPGFDAFYERLRNDPELPTTSQPSIGDFLEVWEPLLESGHDVVSVHLAGGISGTVEAARQAHGLLVRARRRRPRRGDRRRNRLRRARAAGAVGRGGRARSGADKAAGDRAGAQGRSGAEASGSAWTRSSTCAAGGRIGKAQAWLGGTLKIKPILSLEYEITPVERVRTAGRAFERMVDYARELHAAGSDGWVVQHIQAPEQAERLVERGREIFDSEPVMVSEVGPVIGTYTGSRADRRRRTAPRRCSPERSGSVRLALGPARRRPRSMRAPTAKPTTAAPITISRRWRSTCVRQSVSRVTSPRRRVTDTASSARLASIELRISSAVRAGIRRSARRPAPTGASAPAPAVRREFAVRRSALRFRADRLADFLRLVDRHRRHRRRARV